MTLTLSKSEEARILRDRNRKVRQTQAKAARKPSPKATRGRVTNPAYLQWVRTLPCSVAGPDCHGGIESAHVRYSDAAVGRVNPGLQTKPDDVWTAPLCRRHHREGPHAQHAANERAWWASHGIDASALCLELQARFARQEVSS